MAESFSYELAPNITYWLAPGIHTLGTSEYGQFQPDNGDTFIGAAGAVLSGQGVNQSAFVTTSTDVTIEYLTIENFVSPQGQMVVNHSGGADWTIKYNTIEDNAGAGVGIGTGDSVSYNCLTHNGEYGFSSFAGSHSFTLTANEISYNDTANWEVIDPGCGCSGGGKFWGSSSATVSGNYIHNNSNVGVWVDTDNSGFNISGNYISNNFAEAIIYELSYNARISNNTLIDNGWGAEDSGYLRIRIGG